MGDPGPFTCLFFTPLTTAGFEETVCLVGGQKLAYAPSTLWAVLQVGPFSFLSAKLGPVWPKPAPDRAEAGRSPTWGGNRPHGASWGQNGGLGWFCGAADCGWFSQCRKERKGRKIPLGGSGRNLRHLLGIFQGCKEAMCKGVLFSFYTICRRFHFSEHKMSKCAPHPFALLHSSFFSQPIPLVGQANGLHIAS